MVVEVAFGRVLDPLAKPPVGSRPVPMSYRGEDEGRVDTGDLLVCSLVSREAERLLEAGSSLVARSCGADQRECRDDDLSLSKALRELSSSRTPDENGLVIEGQHSLVRHVRVGERKLPARFQLLEDCDGFAGEISAVFQSGCEVRETGQLSEELSFLEPVSELPVAIERGLRGDESLLDLKRDRALVRPALQQLRDLRRRKTVGEAKGPRVLRRSLAVRAGLRGLLRRSAGVFEYRRRVVCALGVVREAGQVSAAVGGQCGEHARVKIRSSSWSNRLLDRSAGKLVPEADTPSLA